MQIRITGEAASIAEPTDLGRLSVVAEDGADVAAALDGWGRADGPGHVWLDIATLETAALAALPADADTAAWRTAYAAMTAFANENGWLDADRTHLRAHITPAAP